MLYGVAVYWILREYYKDPTNLGMPRPKVLSAPTYLYGILSLASDFTGGFTIPLAAGLTLSLIWQTNAKNASNSLNYKTQSGAAYVGPSPPAQRKFPAGSGPGFGSNPPTPAQTKIINSPGFGK